jgi:hypothetical protein
VAQRRWLTGLEVILQHPGSSDGSLLGLLHPTAAKRDHRRSTLEQRSSPTKKASIKLYIEFAPEGPARDANRVEVNRPFGAIYLSHHFPKGLPVTKSPQHRAILHHPDLGMLRRIDSFPSYGRAFFEGLIGVFDIRCIHLNGGRYIIEHEYAVHCVSGSDRDFDIEADIEADYAKSVSDGSYDLLQGAYEEILNQDQHALAQRASIERTAKNMMTTGCDNVFMRAAYVHPFWRGAAVVAGQFATPKTSTPSTRRWLHLKMRS